MKSPARAPRPQERPAGVLLILNDIEPAMEREFNRWYREQHLQERLAIPGFKAARRYRAVGGQPRYMAVYDCESVEVLASAPYRARLDGPSAWTRKIMPAFRNMLRSACRVSWSSGDGMAGAAVVVQCQPVRGREQEARAYIQRRLAPCLMERDGLVRMSLWEADADSTGDGGREGTLRGGRADQAQWVLFLETYDLGKTALALHGDTLAGEAAAAGLLIGLWTRYELMYAHAERTAPQ